MTGFSLSISAQQLRTISGCCLGLAVIVAVVFWSNRSVESQPTPAVRKVYVPDEAPGEWPKGDWRPLSTQKYLQWLRGADQSAEAETFSRFQQVDYTCRFDAGRLVDGQLAAHQPYLPAGRDWISLGRTNLSLADLDGPDQQPAWGTARDGRLYVHRSLLEGGMSARWNMVGMPAADGDRFSLELLPAQQSRLTIVLPDHLGLQVIEPANAPVFQRPAGEGMQACTIEGLEKSTLVFDITAVTESESQQTSIARAIHQLTMSPSEMSFVSDLKFEYIGRPGRRIAVQLPEGLDVETVQWQQESLTSWDVREFDDQAERRLLVTLPETATVGTLRFRGTINSPTRMTLETTFPQLLDALTLSMQVNLLVRTPYLLEELQTVDLDQIDVRLVNGVRDVWSYQATGSQPKLKATVTQPDPQVRIEQLLRVEADERTQVHQIMLWKAQQEGVFHARFRIAPGYDVQDVTLLGQISDAGVSWNILRQERGNVLIVHLANQLIPGQPLPVVVSLGNTFSNERSKRLTLPPLQLISGKVERTFLVDQGTTVLRTVPERSDLPAMTAAEAERWTILTEPRVASLPYAWQPSWRVVDISELERVIVRPLPSVLAEEETLIPSEQAVKLSTSLLIDGQDVLVRHQLQIPSAARRNSDVVRLHVPADQATWNWYLSQEHDSLEAGPVSGASRATAQLVLTAEGDYEYRFYNGRGLEDDSQPLLWETYYRPDKPSIFTLKMPTLETEWKSECEVDWQTGAFFVHSTDLEPTEMQLDGDTSRLLYSCDRQCEVTVRRAANGNGDAKAAAPWQMEVAAFVAPENPAATQIAVALGPPMTESVLTLPTLKFSSPVELNQVQINGRAIAIRQSGTEITLPATEEPVRDLVFSYTSQSADRLVLPELPLPVQAAGLVLAIPNASRPVTDERISFWNEIPVASLADELPATTSGDSNDDGVANYGKQMQRSQAMLAAWRLLSGISSESALSVYEAKITSPLDGDLRFTFQREPLSWTQILAVFLLSLIVCGMLLSFDLIPRFSWAALAIIGVVVAWCVTDERWLSFLYPLVAALVLTATEMTGWVRGVAQLQAIDVQQAEKRAPALRHLLFRGLFGLFLVMLFVSKHERAVLAAPEQYDILIPVAGSDLGINFPGLVPEDYPDVIYATPALANRVAERAAPLKQLSEILFRTSRFDVSELAENRIGVRCEFTLLDPDPSQARTRLLLPLSNLSTLTDLKAEVNGQIVNITPLPDDSGLEIPLPPASASEDNTDDQDDEVSPPVDEGVTAPPFREIQIVINAVARRMAGGAEGRSSLNIPPATLNRVNWSLPASSQVMLQVTNRADDLGIPLVSDQNSAGTLEFGRVEELRFDTNQRTGTDATAAFEQLQTDVLCDVGLRHVELKMNLFVKFGQGSRRTMEWMIPDGLYVRGIHAPDVTDSRMSDAADGKTRLELKFGAVKAGETSSVLLSLMQPITPGEETVSIPLPRYVSRQPTDLVWQIALQAESGGQLTAVEFPEAASSRISQQTFVTNWPDMETILADVQCFRVKSPTRLKVLWNETVSQYSVVANHQLVRKEGQPLQLTSRYRGTSLGRPFWMFDWLGAEGWTLEEVKASVDGRDVQTRSIQAPVRSLAFSDDVTMNFEVTATWVWLDAEQPSQFPFTPPRIASAAPYRETISHRIDDGRRYLLRLDEQANRQVEVMTTPGDFGTLTMQGNNAYDLPSVILERQVGPTRPVASVTEPTEVESSEGEGSEKAIPDFKAPGGETNGSEIRSVGDNRISVDHTLWPENDRIYGESLIVCDMREFALRSEFTIELPPEVKTVEIVSSDGLQVHRGESTLTVRPTRAFETLDYQFHYVLLNWSRPTRFSLFGQQRVPLPSVEQAAPVRWRAIRFEQSGAPDVALVSWQNYLKTLEKLGQSTNEELSRTLTSSPFAVEDQILQTWPPAFREYYDMLPEPLQRLAHRGSQRIRSLTRTKPHPAYFAHVVQSDVVQDSAQNAVLKQPSWQPHVWLAAVGCLWIVFIGQRRGDDLPSRGQRTLGRVVCLLLACLMIWRLTV